VNIANTYVLSLFYTEEGFSQGEVDHLFSALVLANFTCGLPVYGAVDSDLTKRQIRSFSRVLDLDCTVSNIIPKKKAKSIIKQKSSSPGTKD
ncbi:unnamed protein product, partial [Porites lobata]